MQIRVIPRILIIALFYIVVFMTLISVQFAKRGAFTRNVGGLVITGHYRMTGGRESSQIASEGPNEYFLDGEVHVFFGGMDFSLVKKGDGHSLNLTGQGWTVEALPERMFISGSSVNFRFQEGAELIFTTHYSGNSVEMRITGVFAEGVTGIELPFKLQRRTGIRGTGDGQFIVDADGVNYSFGYSPIDAERRVLLIQAGGELVSYRTIPEFNVFSPNDFIIPEAQTVEAYNTAITRWRDQQFSHWSRVISGQDNEDIVVALVGEAYNRGNYRAAINSISAAFLRGNNRTYESSVYLGGMDQAYRDLITADDEKLSRITRAINEKSLEFLIERDAFEYLGIRGQQNLMDAGADLVDTIDASILALDIIPGIFEGYTDWEIFADGTDNPFERLIDPACLVISEVLARVDNVHSGNSGAFESRVFLLNDDGTENFDFNLRLGKALMICAESVGNSSWAGVGRSLVLSVLYGPGENGIAHSEQTSARLYRILCPMDAYPHAVTLVPQPNVWAWTTVLVMNVIQQPNIIDIDVTFLVGEIHYMIIRGVQPFNRLQLYNIDFRTDPQFERYDSSGWSYNTQEQTLILKMQHRSQVERIRIIY